MKYRLFLTFFLFLSISLSAATIDKSYSIVIPVAKNKIENRYNKLAADLFQEAILKSAGIKLNIVLENQYHGSKAVFIGNTIAASKAGITLNNFTYNQSCAKSDGKGNLYILGRYLADVQYSKASSHKFHEVATLRGVCEFLREYTNMRVFLPGKKGRFFAKKKVINFEDNLNKIYTPSFSYVIGRPGPDPIYDIANGYLSAPWYKTYGGHSHPVAIPLSLYSQHPEYFILTSKGKRWKGLQYCISNKNVQELIYKEMLKQLDSGYEWVQLAQTDGFSKCACKPCKNLFNTSDYGEKLWILHRNLANRLKKDRPGKKVVILSYPPTDNVPKTFKDFPDNVIIEICKYDSGKFKEWQNVKVPGSFVVYVYNWGVYHPSSYSPSFTMEDSINQIKEFQANNIKGIYKCGFGEMFGLCGPDYYAYGYALNHKGNGNSKDILDDYCNSLYGKAATNMKDFHTLLYSRLKLNLKQKHDNYHQNLQGKMPAGYSNYQLFNLRYPSEILKVLSTKLQLAQKLEPKNDIIKLVTVEYNFLELSAKMSSTFLSYLANPNEITFNKMKASVEARENYLTKFTYIKNKIKPIANIPVLGGANIETLREGGSWKGRFVYPRTWDLDFLAKEKIYPGARKLKVNSVAQKLLPAYLDKTNDEFATVKASSNDKNLTISLMVPNLSKQELFYIVLFDKQYVFRNTYLHPDVYDAKSGKKLSDKRNNSLVKIQTANNNINVIFDWRLIPNGQNQLLKGIPFNIYRNRQKDRKEFVYEPDIKVLNGRKSMLSARGLIVK